MAIEAKRIMSELRSIKEDLKYIKKHIPDRDVFLDSEEKMLLEKSYHNERKGKLLTGKELRRKLEL